MQSTQEDKMSREEIIYYVDNLIEANKKSYDKRLAPLLYEFFLRANEKFGWSREKFFEKITSFKDNVANIGFEKMKRSEGYFNNTKGIFLNKEIIRRIKENPESGVIYKYIINCFFHECQHATDLLIDDGIAVNYGLYEISEGTKINEKDTMLYEYANVLSTTIIASDEPMYYYNFAIAPNNTVGYEELILPGSIICSALDMSEIELAKLKDKGRDAFNLYLKNKFLEPEIVLDSFESNLNTIYNAYENDDKQNIALAVGNIVDVAVININGRVRQIFLEGENIEKNIERIYYDIYKIKKILEKVDSFYGIEDDKKIYNFERFETIEKLLDKVKLYKRFLDNRDTFTIVQQAQIHRGIIENDESIVKELIESNFEEEYYQNERIDIEEIVKKYYPQSNEPLNDNTALIEQVKQSFIKPTIKEKFKKILGIKEKQLLIQESKVEPELSEQPMLIQEAEVELEISENTDYKETLRYETPIIHDKGKEKQDTSIEDEESTRDGNEDIR